ncbi:MAG: hypothetical protein RIS88_2647 [Pseudomonadota bacterium]|jgi:uncharacterized SAM-binding protein YcdF (DUF218 family)
MQFGDIKALASPLVLPPAGPLLAVMLALLVLGLTRRGRRLALVLGLAGAGALWLLSCHAVAIRFAGALLPLPEPVAAPALAGTQAVVVLGGGVLAEAPEYGAAQPSSATLARLRYGIRLARTHGLPLAFAGGLGWGGRGTVSEAQAVALSARDDFGFVPRWLDDQSRDTRENAEKMAALMHPQGVRRIALVSDAWHLPRAALEFRRAGFEVVPAPTRQPLPQARTALEWLPSTEGLTLSRQVLREWLALRAAQWATP